MTGSFLVLIITPIVAVIALAFWLGMVFWADAHPGWKARSTAPDLKSPASARPPRQSLASIMAAS
jgi:hypothetical protein